jgi:hypothetical protein
MASERGAAPPLSQLLAEDEARLLALYERRAKKRVEDAARRAATQGKAGGAVDRERVKRILEAEQSQQRRLLLPAAARKRRRDDASAGGESGAFESSRAEGAKYAGEEEKKHEHRAVASATAAPGARAPGLRPTSTPAPAAPQQLAQDPPWALAKFNPHIAQFFQGAGPRSVTRERFCRTLEPNAPRIPYRRRRGELKTVVSWPSRMCLLLEAEFLTRFAEAGSTVLYVGQDTDVHFALLCDMFPELRFILVDPQPQQLRTSARLEIYYCPFSDDIGELFSDRRALLISATRAAPPLPPDATQEEMESAALQDLEAQRHMVEVVKPERSLLRFSLPWRPGATTYMRGTLYLPVWGGQTAVETRIVVTGDGSEVSEWDHTMYEEQMFRFNTVTRVQCYPHAVVAEGLDHCFDCASEAEVLRSYVTRRFSEWLETGAGASPLEFLKQKKEQRLQSEEAHASRQNQALLSAADLARREPTQPPVETAEQRAAAAAERAAAEDKGLFDESTADLSQALSEEPFPTPLERRPGDGARVARLLAAVGQLSEYLSQQLSEQRTLRWVPRAVKDGPAAAGPPPAPPVAGAPQ